MREFLRQLYWALRRKPPAGRQGGVAGHVLRVVPGAFAAAARLRQAGDRRRTVAIALLEHLGDIVAAEPIARLARRQFPDARIMWITRPPFASIPACYPEVDDVVTLGCLTEWIILRRLVRFDTVWDLHINNRACPWCRVPLVKFGVALEERNYYDHGNLLSVACACAGLTRLTESPVITPPAAAVATVDALALPPRYIVVHAVSSTASRDWPAAKWRDLTMQILAADPAVCLLEVGLRSFALAREDGRQTSLCGRLNILETAEVIRRAVLFVGIDSGPAHLANAVGTPGVILLGDYGDFRAHMPYSGRYETGELATIVRAHGLVMKLSVAAVFAAVQARLVAVDDVPRG